MAIPPERRRFQRPDAMGRSGGTRGPRRDAGLLRAADAERADYYSDRRTVEMKELRALLFDFDGTLVRTREASWELFQQTNEKFSLGLRTPSEFYRLFDQNFYVALDEAAASRANAPSVEVREHFMSLLRTDYTPDLV